MQNATERPKKVAVSFVVEGETWTVQFDSHVQLQSADRQDWVITCDFPPPIAPGRQPDVAWLARHNAQLVCIGCWEGDLWWIPISMTNEPRFGSWRRVWSGRGERGESSPGCAAVWAGTVDNQAHLVSCSLQQRGRVVELLHRAFNESTASWVRLGRMHSRMPAGKARSLRLQGVPSDDAIALDVEVAMDDSLASYRVVRLAGGWPRSGWRGGRWQVKPGKATEHEVRETNTDESQSGMRNETHDETQMTRPAVTPAREALAELNRWVLRHEALQRGALVLASQRTQLRRENREMNRTLHQLRARVESAGQQRHRLETEMRHAVVQRAELEARLREAHSRIGELADAQKRAEERARQHVKEHHTLARVPAHETAVNTERAESPFEVVIGRLVRWVRE